MAGKQIEGMTFPELQTHWHQQAREDWQELRDECLCFKPIRKPSEWAAEERRIAAGTSPMAQFADIPYDHAVMPHCVEPMDAADDQSVNKIVLWFAVRDGKTLGVCCNIIGRTVTDDPGNIYSVHPTEDDAERFSIGDVEPMIESCLEGYFVEKKSRDAGRTKDFKKFAGGWIRIVSAGSITKFRGTSVKILCLHELDALEKESIHKAINRTTGYKATIIMESTGTLTSQLDDKGQKVYRSNIQEFYEKGDQRKWFVPCRECGHLFTINFGHIRYSPGAMHEARVHCPDCGIPHNENQWRTMQRKGRWLPTAGLSEEQVAQIEKYHNQARAADPTVRSYWRNGFNSLLGTGKGFKTKLHEFVAEEAASHSSPEARKTWINERAAELWNDDGDVEPAPLALPIINGRESYATPEAITIPMKGRTLHCFTDVHPNRLEIEWRAFARDEESWGLKHTVLMGNINQGEIWEEWVKLLQKKFRHESGIEIGLTMGLIDAGHDPTAVAYGLNLIKSQQTPGVWGKMRMSIGVGRPRLAIVASKWAAIGKRYKGVHIGTWQAKALIYDRLSWHGAPEKPEAGFMHYGQNYMEEYIRQLVVEDPVRVIKDGAECLTFENKKQLRNEALDLAVGNLAAFRFLPWDVTAVEEAIAAATARKEAPAPTMESYHPPQQQRGGLGTGWNL